MPVDFDLYLITDRHQVSCGDLPAAVEQALRGGVRAVQLREKDLSSRDLCQLARELRKLTRHHGARLLINDRIDVALAVDADGVHLPENGMPLRQARQLLPTKLIGVSCHNLAGAQAAQNGGANFITFGPIFSTPSKACYGPPVGLEQLAKAVAGASIPVFGLGGIDHQNLREVLDHGAAGVALISAILAAEEPQRAAETIRAAMRGAVT